MKNLFTNDNAELINLLTQPGYSVSQIVTYNFGSKTEMLSHLSHASSGAIGFLNIGHRLEYSPESGGYATAIDINNYQVYVAAYQSGLFKVILREFDDRLAYSDSDLNKVTEFLLGNILKTLESNSTVFVEFF